MKAIHVYQDPEPEPESYPMHEPDEPSPEPVRRRNQLPFILLGIFLMVFLLMFTKNDYSSVNAGFGSYQDIFRSQKRTSLVSKDNVKLEIEKAGLLCQDVVFAQVLLESGNLKSELFRKTNNLAGMRYPFRRKTNAIGLFLPSKKMIILGDQRSLQKFRRENQFAVYASWQDCIADYKHWQDECFRIKDRYLKFLEDYYAQAPNYDEQLRIMSGN